MSKPKSTTPEGDKPKRRGRPPGSKNRKKPGPKPKPKPRKPRKSRAKPKPPATIAPGAALNCGQMDCPTCHGAGTLDSDGAPVTKIGRPVKYIDYDLVERLAKICCTTEEIAAVTGVCKRTLENNALEFMQRGRNHGRAALRREQFRMAKAGNPTMLVWLGKQWLAQTDRQDLTVRPGADLDAAPVDSMTAAELDNEITRLTAIDVTPVKEETPEP